MNKKAGLYYHIPFCANKCPYCDFYSVKYDGGLAEKYVQRLCKETEEYNGEFDTVYFGGGTPSIIDSSLIGRIIEKSKEQFEIDKNAEITIECNPSKNLEKDFKFGYTTAGIHRDDLNLYVNNVEVKNFGSQGQQRTVALSLKLAELECNKNRTGQYPILLLDDVFSELDEERRKRLLKFTQKTQTIITGTEITEKNNGKVIKIIKKS